MDMPSPVRGLCAAAGPALFLAVVAAEATAAGATGPTAGTLLGGAGAGGGLLLAAALASWPRGSARAATLARWAAFVAFAAAAVTSGPALAGRPALALSLLVAATCLLALVVAAPVAQTDVDPRMAAMMAARRSAELALVTAIVGAGLLRAVGPAAAAAAAAGLLVAAAYAWRWRALDRRARTRSLLTVSFVAAPAVAVAGWLLAGPSAAPFAALPGLCLPPAALLVGTRRRAPLPGGLADSILGHPARLLVTTFLALCAGGALLLLVLPSGAPGVKLSLTDAAFSATSAVCVTGLVVLDPATKLSLTGQIVILALIQVGGLGIMTFSTAALGLLGRRLSLRHEAAMAAIASGEDRSSLFGALRRTLVVTCIVEGVGAACLAALFRRAGDPLPTALWRGVFTSISAFCNAGFALQTDSLVPYQRDPLVLHVVAALIVAGGLSPAILSIAPGVLLRRRRRLPLTAVVAVGASAALCLAGAVAFAAFEWTGALHGLPLSDRLHNAWFQSVTTRTAGFNSVDLGALSPATLAVMMALMFVGGSPGGTAGGIKTTTLFVLLLAVVAALRGRSEVSVRGRRISHDAVYRAAAIATLGALAAGAGLMGILVTQDIPGDQALFEVISALGTVGLSIGATPALDDVGRILIMAGMYLGRVGPLTAFLFLADRRAPLDWSRPGGQIDVG